MAQVLCLGEEEYIDSAILKRNPQGVLYHDAPPEPHTLLGEPLEHDELSAEDSEADLTADELADLGLTGP